MAFDDINDPHNLQRFVLAQNAVYGQVCQELRQGCKRSHWMWFIFPQVQGLGHSSTAIKFSIASLAEAKAYLAHPILGPRLRECAELVNRIEGRAIDQIFYYPDDLKFHSSMTLFTRAASENQIFMDALDKYFEGKSDDLTTLRI